MEKEKRQASEPEKVFLSEAIEVWAQSSITLLDLRHQTINGGARFDYRMPSSMLLYAYGGAAEVSLDDRLYSVERFGVFHGGKGSRLSITPIGDETKVYSVFYKAEDPPFYKMELKRLLHVVNPFLEQYGFAPRSPLYFMEQLGKMHKRWNGCTPLDRFYGKAAFWSLVYEIYEELAEGGVQVLQPDLVSLVKRHIDEHYQQTLSLQQLAETFYVSSGHLTRLFKKQEGISPQKYLIRTRVEAARARLLDSEATLREIASSCGFSDEFNLIKMFKSCFGVTPGDFRKTSSIRLIDSAIGSEAGFPYAERGRAGLNLISGKGDYAVGRTKKGTLLFTGALCLTLMLSACSTSTPAGNNSQANAIKQPNPTVSTEGMREFEHSGGTTLVPANPKRIVADWYYGELLVLGLRPIGYPEYLLSEYSYVEPEGTEGLGEAVEQVVELQPDLIISTWDESYEQFAQIAPSVLLKLNNGVIDRMRVLGELVNKQEAAEEWIASFEKKLAQSKQRLAKEVAPGTTVSILNVFNKDLKVSGYRNMGGDVIYNLLELEPPQKVKEMFEKDNAWNHNISFEALPEVAGTHIILTAYDPEGAARETLAELEKSQIWNSLDAVKNGRVHVVPYYDLFFDDPIAVEHQIEMLTDMILN